MIGWEFIFVNGKCFFYFFDFFFKLFFSYCFDRSGFIGGCSSGGVCGWGGFISGGSSGGVCGGDIRFWLIWLIYGMLRGLWRCYFFVYKIIFVKIMIEE